MACGRVIEVEQKVVSDPSSGLRSCPSKYAPAREFMEGGHDPGDFCKYRQHLKTRTTTIVCAVKY
jgi:hypothetical protein